MLEIFLADQLFCSFYPALCLMEEQHQAPSPIKVWMGALQIKQKAEHFCRADLIIGRMFADKSEIEALCEEAVIFYMFMTTGREESQKPTALKDALAQLLQDHGELWKTLYEKIRKSEQDEELKGYYIDSCDYSKKLNQLISIMQKELDTIKENNLDLKQAKEVVRIIVDNCMGLTSDTIEGILVPLMSTNEQYNCAFNEEVNRLKEKLGIKTETKINFEKLNDIHDNEQVHIGKYNYGRYKNEF